MTKLKNIVNNTFYISKDLKRENSVLFVIYISLFTNIFLFGIKYWAGITTNSIAIIADAWHTLFDSITSLIVLLSINISAKPADKRHPFGHGRIDLICSIIIGIILAFVALNFFIESIKKLINHQIAVFNTFSIIAILISVIFKEALAQISIKTAKKNNYEPLRADGWHHRTDALTSLLILIAIFSNKYFWWIDPVLGIIITFFIFYVAINIIKNSIHPLIGESPSKKLVAQIKKIVAQSTDYNLQPHHIHIHKYGDHIELTFHITLPAKLNIKQAYTIIKNIENSIKEKLNIETTIRIEPDIT